MPPLSPTAAEFERQILENEGPYRVGGVYYADLSDAERQRRWAAERMAREARRLAEYVARRLATTAAEAAEGSDPTASPRPGSAGSATATRAAAPGTSPPHGAAERCGAIRHGPGPPASSTSCGSSGPSATRPPPRERAILRGVDGARPRGQTRRTPRRARGEDAGRGR